VTADASSAGWCDETTKLFEERWRARIAREDAHLRYLERTARDYGIACASMAMTKSDADARLERLVNRRDPEIADDVRLVPWHIGVKVARDAFRDGVELGRRTRGRR
jgi:hypothetical protein